MMNKKKSNKIPPRGYVTYGAHLFKAIFRKYHQELIPVFRPYIKKNACIIDVGAHAGQFAKMFARIEPSVAIHAFEPARYTRSILSCMASIHRLKNVTIVPLGLGSANDDLTLNIPIKSSGSLGYGLSHIGDVKEDENRPTYQEKISIIKLDDYIADNKIEKVDFIKADIEGWELQMLSGAIKTIEKHKPVLFLEINDNFLGRAGDSSEDMMIFLRKHGYNVFMLEGGKDKLTLSKIDESNSCKNIQGDILCVHQG